ncbi:hypothetical protein [Photobacterium swingsii]|uniref:hypothetical protein n=1 Tax=Photobacterium swingsii TaxID=680026 RepID=UPI004067B8DF
MPSYYEAGDLARWDSDYHCSMGEFEDESNFNFQIITLIYELAGLNLFGTYNPKESVRVYRLIVKELNRRGISVTGGMDVSAW